MPKITKMKEETKDEKRRDKILIAALLLILLIFFTMLLTSTFAKEIYDKISDQIIEVLDLHKPTAPKIDTDDKTWTKEALVKVVKDAKAKDGLDYYEYCVSSEKNTKNCNWQKTTTKNAIIANSGTYYVTFRAIDKESRKGDISNQVQVYVDNNIPKIEKVETKEVTDNKIVLETTATDEHSGIDKYQYSINNSEYKDGTITNTFDNLKANTKYTIAIKVIDKVGNEIVYTTDITTKKLSNTTGDKEDSKSEDKEDSKTEDKEDPEEEKEVFDIPVINLDKVPTTFTYGDSYTLPSYYSFGNDTGVVSCVVEGKEYTDTKDLTIGKHLIVCNATSSHNKRVMVEKEVNVKPRTSEDELLDGWIILNLYYPLGSTNWEWRLAKPNTVRIGENNDDWQDYTGPIMVKLTDVENVYIRYDLNDETVIESKNGKAVIDIEPDKYEVKSNEQTSVKINYDKRCSNQKYKLNGGVWQDYTETFSVGKNTLIEAECLILEDVHDSEGNYIFTSKRTIYDGVYINEYKESVPSGTHGGGGSIDPIDPTIPGSNPTPTPKIAPAPTIEILDGPTVTHTPNSLADEVTVSITTEYPAEKIFYRIGKSGTYQEYTNSFKVNKNCIITAYYVRASDGKVSDTTYHYIQNIKKPNMPYVKITANPDNYLTEDQEEVTVTITGSDYNKLEYSLDGVIYKTYTNPLTIKESATVYAKGTNNNGTTIESLQIVTITAPKQKEKLNINISLTPDKSDVKGLVNTTTATINYDPKAENKYYRLGGDSDYKPYTGPITITENTTIYAYATSSNGKGDAHKSVDFLTTGISDPIINVSTKSPTQQVKVEIEYDNNAEITRYKIGENGTYYDYNGPFYVYENTTIYAYNKNSLNYDATSSRTIANIVAAPSYKVLDKGKYIILKLNYPNESDTTTLEYKWKENGTWKSYDSKGILLIKAEYKDEFINGIEDGIKVENSDGKQVIFTDHYYILDVPVSELSENLFMRWDTVKPNAPSIITSTQDPDKEVSVGISYSNTMSKKYYRVVTPTSDTGWKEYDKPIKVAENNAVIYAKGITSQEIESNVSSKTITNIDEIAPTISIQGDITNPKQQVTLKLVGKDNLGIDRVLWIKSSKTEEECLNNGNNIPNNSTFTVTENDTYTICAIDKVGNITKEEVEVNNIDTNAPDINIYVETTTLSKEISVVIDYNDSAVKEYKIGSNDTYKTYNDRLIIKGEDVQNLKNSDGSITIYAKGLDEASNETIVTETTYVLDTDMPNTPIINATAGYPVLTEYGVKLSEKSSIVFDTTRDDITNYYSIDNGITWKIYKGPFEIATGTIMAKSVKNNTGLTVTASKKVVQPSDALKLDAYDGNTSTGVSSTNLTQKLYIDETIQNRSINVIGGTYNYLGRKSSIILTFKTEDGLEISSTTLTDETSHNRNLQIPVNAKVLEVKLYSGSGEKATIYEVSVLNTPVLKEEFVYPLINTYGIKDGYSNVEIEYFPTSVEKLYKINDGEWTNYENKKIKLKYNDTIYAKSIDKDGQESKVLTYTVSSKDSLGINAYDGNTSTGVSSTNLTQKLYIDETMQNKSINVIGGTYNYLGRKSSIILTFKTEDGLEISSTTLTNETSHNRDLQIPVNAKVLEVKLYSGSGEKATIYEVSVLNTPVLKEEFIYPVLTEDGIKDGYSNIEIEYFPTSVEKLYKINDGEWQKYENKKIKLEYNDTIYAKSIDKYGQESKVLSYTVSSKDSLGINAYDENTSTGVSSTNLTQKLYIDETMQNKSINVIGGTYNYLGRKSSIILTFKTEDGLEINSTTLTNETSHNRNLQIPVNAKVLEVKLYSGSGEKATIYEVSVLTTPTFTQINHYPVLLGENIETNYIELKINYLSNTTNRKYSTDNGITWKDYTESIKVTNGMKVLAKAIDKDGQPTETVTYNIVDFNDYIGINSYDNDYETIDTINANTNKSFVVDGSSVGKKLRVYLKNTPSTTGNIAIYDENNTLLDTTNLTDIVTLITIPENAYKVTISAGSSSLNISEINIRPILSINPVENPLINVNYNGWARNKTVDITYAEGYINQYSLDFGANWLDYTLPITLDKPTLVMARSLDNNKVVASSTFNVTRIDNVDAEIYFDFGDKVGLGIDKKLPSRAKLGLSSSEPICKIGDDVVTTTANLALGTYTVTCTTTNGMNVTTTATKTFEIVEAIPIEGESILSILEQDLDEGLYEFIVNDESYTVHLYVLEGNQTITENTKYGDTKDCATGTTEDKMAKNMVIVKVKGDYTVNSGVTVGPYYDTNYGGPKGFMLYVTGKLTNNGTIDNSHGAYAKGQNVYLWKNSDGTYEYIPAVGANGGNGVSSSAGYCSCVNANGNTGSNGTLRATGGGGSGSGYTCCSQYIVSSGGTGTSYSGGIGSGSANACKNTAATSAFGGSNNSCGSDTATGAGNPSNGTGGLLVIYANEYQNNGNIAAHGSSATVAKYGAGASGGGSINIFTNQSTNIDSTAININDKYNTIKGNTSITGGSSTGTSKIGGAGGTGTVNIGEIRNGQYYDLKTIIEKDMEDFENAVYTNRINGDSLFSILDNNLESGYYLFTVKDVNYKIHLIVLDGNQTITQNTQYGDSGDCAIGTSDSQMAKNMVIVKVNGDYTVNSGVTVGPYYDTNYGGPKGFMLYVTGKLTNNGTIDNSHGAYAKGEDVYLWKNSDGTYEYVPALGASGGAAPVTKTLQNDGGNALNGNAGSNGSNRSTGGGGSGSIRNYVARMYAGAGGAGTSYSGGSGGGAAATDRATSRTAGSGSNYGGPGGHGAQGGAETGISGGNTNGYGQAAGGGAGNGPGNQVWSTATASVPSQPSGTGGLLIIYSSVFDNNGKISANGYKAKYTTISKWTGSQGGGAQYSGGSSGGGSVNVFYANLVNKGSNEANGGTTQTTNCTLFGGAGGNGTVTYTQISF